MRRTLAAALVVLALAALLAWQWTRERQMSACLASGGVWNGPKSRCDPTPGRPILQRGIERS